MPKFNVKIFLIVIIIALIVLFLNSIINPQIAAKISDTSILENEVTNNIQEFRELNNYLSNDTWKEYLNNNSTDAASVRDGCLNELIAEKSVIKYANERGIFVSENEINDAVNENINKYFESKDEYLAELKESNMSENQYKNNIKMTLYVDKLTNYLKENNELDDIINKILLAECGDKINNSYGYYMLTTNSKEEAEEYAKKLNNNEITSSDAAKQICESNKNNNYSGERFTFLDNLPNVVINELNSTPIGTTIVSKQTLNGKEYNYILLPVEKISCENPLTSINNLSEDLKNKIIDFTIYNYSDEITSSVLKLVKDNYEVVKYDMPSGLPYDV